MNAATFWQSVQSKLERGFDQLRQSAAGALTRFKAGSGTQMPPAADIDLPQALANPGWGLVGGDVFEDEQRVVVRLELPGMDRKDFEVDVTPEQLTVRGEKKFEREQTEGRWRVMQCAYGSFQRHVALPVPVKTDEVRAVYKDGVLKVELPKAVPARPQARTVPVH
ncbi:MAG: Hsp20/alpha crystallin family protein [Rubrivivax sp.]|nr:Hsp20/alpha crystallin family protein [Rubrivivax sp.]